MTESPETRPTQEDPAEGSRDSEGGDAREASDPHRDAEQPPEETDQPDNDDDAGSSGADEPKSSRTGTAQAVENDELDPPA